MFHQVPLLCLRITQFRLSRYAVQRYLHLLQPVTSPESNWKSVFWISPPAHFVHLSLFCLPLQRRQDMRHYHIICLHRVCVTIMRQQLVSSYFTFKLLYHRRINWCKLTSKFIRFTLLANFKYDRVTPIV